VSAQPRLVLASPHRYADLARLWYRFVRRELQPAFVRRGVHFEVNIFCDGDAAGFAPDAFPGVLLSSAGPGMRDFMEFYDAALRQPCEFLFFADADVFFLDGEWVASQFETFLDADVVAVSCVPRKDRPAIFALLCRADAYRSLSAPRFACRYEFPDVWPNGVNLQPGDFAARELTRQGKRIVNIDAKESSKHIAMFRSTTGVRTTREQITRASGVEAFYEFLAQNPACIAAGYDNLLLSALYERLFSEPFAPDESGTPLGGSITVSELKIALSKLRDPQQLDELAKKFRVSHRAISQIAAREGLELRFPELAAEAGAHK
jgi:hypothetical protein